LKEISDLYLGNFQLIYWTKSELCRTETVCKKSEISNLYTGQNPSYVGQKSEN